MRTVFFLSIRIVTVARIEDEWGALGPSVSTSGHIARPFLTIQKKGKTMSYYAYVGPLGEVVRHGAPFIAARDGFLIGTYNTFGEAMESLRGKGELKHSKLTISKFITAEKTSQKPCVKHFVLKCRSSGILRLVGR